MEQFGRENGHVEANADRVANVLECLVAKLADIDKKVEKNSVAIMKAEGVSAVIDKKLDEAIQELNEQARRTSAIVFELPESEEEDSQKRVEHDSEHTKNICQALGVKGYVSKVIRLGKRSVGMKARPMKVVMASEEGKVDLIKAAKSRLSQSPQYHKIAIRADRTPKERSVMNEAAGS